MFGKNSPNTIKICPYPSFIDRFFINLILQFKKLLCCCGYAHEAKQLAMTTILNFFSPQIGKFIEQKQFNELHTLFYQQSIPVRELIIFYKRYSKVLSNVSYWQSQLPLLHIEFIIKSDIKVNWITSYLKRGDNCNSEINSKLLEIDFSEFIRFLKYTKAFEITSFFSSLNELKNAFPALEKHTKEFAVVKRKLSLLRTEASKDEVLLLQFPLHFVLSAFSLYYHWYKQQSVNANNKADQTKIEYAIVEEVDRIIQLFFEHKRQNLQFSCFSNNKESQLHFDKYCEPHHILGKKTPHFQSQELQFLYKQFTNMISRKSLKGLIDMYCCGYSDFTNSENEPYNLKTNTSFMAFEFNNKKSQPEELYLSNIAFDKTLDVVKNERVDTSSEERYFKYYGIPLEINFNEETIDMLKACRLLKHMSVYKGPPERTFMGTQYVTNNFAPVTFRELFGNNESISLFEYSTFIENISKYFSWSMEECKRLVTLLATNLDEEQKQGEWISNPIIICQGKILWIGNLLKDRNWGTILLNKIKSEKLFSRTVTMISKNVETNAIDLFKSVGFNAFGLGKISTNDGKATDVDVIAYKDGQLILAEVKSGSRSDDYNDARYYEMIRLEGTAAEQLETVEQYVKENWDKIKTENRIEDSKPIDQIQIHSLIITDYFEGDLELYKNKYSKVSLLELEVLIKNNKKKLFEMYLIYQSLSNGFNHDYNSLSNKAINYDLWDGATSLSPELLLNKIETNEVWAGIEKIWLLKPFEYNLV